MQQTPETADITVLLYVQRNTMIWGVWSTVFARTLLRIRDFEPIGSVKPD